MSSTQATTRPLPFGADHRTVHANGVDLCLETVGDPEDPTILLIHGAATGMDGWDDEFCIRLVEGGRFVIRYDHRDTGESVSYEPGAPGYNANDLAEDVVGLLDELDIENAHLVGVSMGGGIAQEVTVRFPERVSSLTLMATTPGGDDLPPPSDAFLEGVSNTAPDWSDRDAVVDHIVDSLRLYAGDNEFDTAAWRKRIDAGYDRVRNVASSQINHFVMGHGEAVRHRLGEISVPTLVIHGTDDPVFPIEHALALQREIPDTRLLELAGNAHLIQSDVWGEIVPAILENTARA